MNRSVGPRRPPVESRFQKGTSGNPKGRPKATREQAESAFDIMIDRMLTVTQGGVPRKVTVEEALQHQTYKEAIAGKRPAQRQILKMIAKREQHLAARESRKSPSAVVRTESVDPDNADAALLILGVASRDEARQGYECEREQLQLEPWAVQAALSRRRGGQRLSDKEVAEIKRCTRAPETLRWPRRTGN